MSLTRLIQKQFKIKFGTSQAVNYRGIELICWNRYNKNEKDTSNTLPSSSGPLRFSKLINW